MTTDTNWFTKRSDKKQSDNGVRFEVEESDDD